ncbi:MAG: ParB/RepB/Spo0J family partition protein [Candidatus Tagabacteria bacterium]
MNEEVSNAMKENGIFWIELDKIKPNPMQPRKEFDEKKLSDLAESIRQYGVLQPLIVTRKEYDIPTGTLVEYELIAGERRLLASGIAGLKQVPVIIREEPAEQVKLELALIENIQREDLNPVERARAFKQLIENFKLKHHEVGAKIGKSREFVTNTLRILALPEEIQDGLCKGLITEGHTRPLLMLSQQPEHQTALYKEIIYKQMNVREAENISRRIAVSRSRKPEEPLNPEIRLLEQKLSDALGTRVSIEKKGDKGKISIEFFSEEELNSLLNRVHDLYAEKGTATFVGLEENKEKKKIPNESQQGGDIIENFTI